jgi:poly-gamma-glutamate capsule biosynthesis protein CapA/YwtB (metallophosphatase superfamily)
MLRDRLPVGAAVKLLIERRPVRAITALAAVLVALTVAVIAVSGLVLRDADVPPAGWLEPPGAGSGPSPTPSPDPAPARITLSAVGDIILGDAGRLPPRDGDGFFDDVREAIAADLVMGNLEEPLTDDTGYRKCGAGSTACHAFRGPPHYAAHLRDAGFHLMNLANNHGNDYGPQGLVNTRAALADHGIAHTGERDQITVVDVRGVAVAVVGFSPYQWTNSLLDLAQAADVVSRADERADLVVVQVHMGAEGSDQTRVRPGTETFFGENRGDPMAFARAVIDAGADLVVGHGPHVMRGLEFYQGRLIAYSLGNFAGGGGTLSAAGPLGLGAVMRVSLTADGGFVDGEFISTHMYESGLPRLDPQRRGLDLVRDVTGGDFPRSGARLDDEGRILPPEP